MITQLTGLYQSIRPKVKAAAGGSAAGSALGILINWILTQKGINPPVPVQGAIITLSGFVVSLISGYLQRA